MTCDITFVRATGAAQKKSFLPKIQLYEKSLKIVCRCCAYRPSAHSFTLRGHKFLKKGQLQGRLKQLSLEQDPGHNTK